MKRGKLQRVEIYVDPEVIAVLTRSAAREGRTVSNYIARVLAEHVGAANGGPGTKKRKGRTVVRSLEGARE
jgi:hypothetical protein